MCWIGELTWGPWTWHGLRWRGHRSPSGSSRRGWPGRGSSGSGTKLENLIFHNPSIQIRWIVKSMIRWQMSSPPKSALSHLASKWIPFSNLTDTEVTFILSIKAWTLKVCAGLLKAGYFYHFSSWHNKKSQVLIWQIRTRAKIDKHHFYDFSWPTRY